MNNEQARKMFYELRLRQGLIDPEELDDVWAGLDPVRIDEILGQWKSTGFDTGHKGSASLHEIRWYGTRFVSQLDAKPLLRYDPDGHVYSDVGYADGEASLWMVEFRGELTATMIFDGMPVLEHFKRVDDTTLFGIMNGKEMVLDNGRHFYFILDKQ